jgi:hypothetical protein
VIKKIFCLCTFSLIILQSLKSQCSPCVDPAPVGIIDYNSARISLLSGSEIQLFFNTIADYKNGVQLDEAVILGVSVCDCTSEGGGAADPVLNSTITGYSLYFDSDDAFFEGVGGNTLPLCFLEASASVFNGFAAPNITISGVRRELETIPSSVGALFAEDSSPVTITDRFWTTDQVAITFYAGVAPANATCAVTFPVIEATNLFPDFYSGTVSFTLVPTCGACVDPNY